MTVQKAYCPGCKAELPQEYLRYPICGCPRCERVIHFPDFREPIPPVFQRLERAARRASTQLHHAWDRGSAKERSEVVNRIKGLIQSLESV